MTQEKQTAFTQAYARCQKRFEQYCVALAYGKMDAQDLIQDVLLSTYERFEQIKHKDQLLHYMIRTARNRSISQWRRARFQTQLREKHTRELFAQGINPEMAVDVQLLYSKMEALPDKQRDALILFDICGFSLKEVADIQQGQVNTVKSHLRRGRKKLQLLMDDKPRKRWLAGLLVTPQIPKVGFGSFKQFIVQLNPIPMYSFIATLLAGSLTVFVSFNSKPSFNTQNPKLPAAQQLEQPLSLAQLFPIQSKPAPTPKLSTNVREISVTPQTLAPKPIYAALSPLARPHIQSLAKTDDLARSSLVLSERPRLSFTFASLNTDQEQVCDSLRFSGNVGSFKRKLLQNLKQDGLIRSKKTKNRITFSGQKILVNKTLISETLQSKYLDFLAIYNIVPCPERFVQTAKKYVAVGRMQEGKFKGMLQLTGKVDIDSFRN